MIHRTLFSIFVLCLTFTPSIIAQSGVIIPGNLRCEYQVDPLGIDVEKPRLSWFLESNLRDQKQTACRILVSGIDENIQQNQVVFWDSGKVKSSQSVHIVYQGKPLRSGRRYYWKVQVWDKDDKPSNWSESAWWEMALLGESDWIAKWINDGKKNPEKDEDFYLEDPAPLFRREFELSKPVRRARLYITGLGYYEACLNGRRVGDHLLDPGWTVYSKRVFYSTYDVTDQIQTGDNCLGVTVGNGWYNPLPMKMWGWLNLREHLTIGRPRFIAQLDIVFTDGSETSIVSNENWKVAPGPVLRNNIYLGEVYDARRELPGWDQPGFNDSAWSKAKLATEPLGPLQAQPLPPIKVTHILKPVKILEPKKGIFIFDMGQNFSGWARLKLDVPEGTKITLRYGELLNKDGTLNPLTSVCGQIKGRSTDEQGNLINVGDPVAPAVAWQSDTYIAKENGSEVYTPRFTFHAFRYVEVTGLPEKPTLDMIEGLRLNSAVEPAGTFSCSNEMFNEIQSMCKWTFLSNMFSVHSDCPHRERFGYGGDPVISSGSFVINFDMANFYAKTVWDFYDSARDDGMLTDTAPYVGIQYCGVAWAMTHLHYQLQLYQFYGDKRIIEQQYETAKRWLDLVAGQNEDHIIKKGLSDHEGLEKAPSPSMVTPLYCLSARMLAQMARIVGRDEQARKYQDLSEAIKKAYLEKFLQPGTGIFSPGTQASQSFALYLDLAPAQEKQAALQYLLNDISNKHKGHLSTGIFGTKFMLDVLAREGYAHIAYDIVNQKTFPGWGYMLENDATTLWEHWALSENTFSHNHPMFGSVSQWFYNWLGGIQPHPNAVGFDQIIIRPQFIEDLQWVKSSYKSIRGLIISNWSRQNKTIHLVVQIPANTTATLYIPTRNMEAILEGSTERKPAAQAQGVRALRIEGKDAVITLGSGKYYFVFTSSWH
ncbi:family 78 glycoside hydrolase catalytic domain [Planctomycetota bacterium]